MPQIVCFGIVKLLYEGKAQDETPGVYGGGDTWAAAKTLGWGRGVPLPLPPLTLPKFFVGFQQVCSFLQIARVSKK